MQRLVALHRREMLTGLSAAAALPFVAPNLDDAAPLDLELSPNLFTRLGVRTLINGKGPFVFVIDTGAGRTTLSRSVVEALDLPSRPPLMVHGVTGAEQADGAGVDRLVIDNVAFRDLHCPVFPDDRVAGHGLLGLDVIGSYRLAFDVVRGAASLTQPGFTIGTNSSAMQTGSRIRREGVRSTRSRFGQLIMTEITIDNQPVDAFIDSGAQYSIGNLRLKDAVAARSADLRSTRAVRLHGVTGDPMNAELARVSRVRFGAEGISDVPLLFADLHCFETLELADRPALLVGADLLACFRVVSLDFPNNLVAFRGRRAGPTPLDTAVSRAV